MSGHPKRFDPANGYEQVGGRAVRPSNEPNHEVTKALTLDGETTAVGVTVDCRRVAPSNALRALARALARQAARESFLDPTTTSSSQSARS